MPTFDIIPDSAFANGFVRFILLALYVAVTWRVAEKTGQPGWRGVIPFVNFFALTRAAGKSGWWVLGLLTPIGFFLWIALCLNLAERFGRGTLFGLGLAFLPVIFFAELAFGNHEYRPYPETLRLELRPRG
jgi:hypothetical protein